MPIGACNTTVRPIHGSGAYAYEWPAVRQRVDDISSGNRPAYHCIVCGAAFNSVSLLRRHTAHEARQDMLNCGTDMAMCVFCGEEHLWMPADIGEKEYDQSGDLTAAKGTLEEHIKTHHDEIRSTTKLFGRHWIKAQKLAHVRSPYDHIPSSLGSSTAEIENSQRGSMGGGREREREK